MPVLPGHVLRRLVRVDDQDLRVPLEEARRRRVDVELAEAPAERLLLVGRQVLVAEEDDPVLDEAVVDRLEPYIPQVEGGRVEEFVTRRVVT